MLDQSKNSPHFINSQTLIVSYIYINDLPKLVIWNAILIIFTDDTSAVTTNSNIVDFQSNIKAVFEQLNNWFTLNLLPLNFDQTNFINFKTQKYS